MAFKVIFKRKRFGAKLALYVMVGPSGYFYSLRRRKTSLAIRHENLQGPYDSIGEAILAAVEEVTDDRQLLSLFLRNLSTTKEGEQWTLGKCIFNE